VGNTLTYLPLSTVELITLFLQTMKKKG